MLTGPGEPNTANTPYYLVRHLYAAVLLSFSGKKKKKLVD